MKKLITYWILLDLIYLFELAFVDLIEWIPFWAHIKLMAICWLVLPYFDGAYNVYEHIRPCFSAHSQVYKNLFSKPSEISLKPESFLAMAERYVQENGSADLEELIASKSKGAKPCVDVKEIKAVPNTMKKEMAEPMEVQCAETKRAEPEKETANQEEIKEKKAATVFEPICAEAEKKTVAPVKLQEMKAAQVAEVKGAQAEKETVASEEIKEDKAAPLAEPQFPHAEKIIFTPMEMKEKKAAPPAEPKYAQAEKLETKQQNVAPEADGENKLPGASSSREVQREWTCAICQVTTPTETHLNSHLQGRKHKAKCIALKASKQTDKNKNPPSSTSGIFSDKYAGQAYMPRDTMKQNNSAKQEKKVQADGTYKQGTHVPRDAMNKQEKNVQGNGPYKQGTQHAGAGMQLSKFYCYICNIRCPGEVDMASHLRGRKHLTRVQEILHPMKTL